MLEIIESRGVHIRIGQSIRRKGWRSKSLINIFARTLAIGAVYIDYITAMTLSRSGPILGWGKKPCLAWNCRDYYSKRFGDPWHK